MPLGLPDLAYIIEIVSNHIDSLYEIQENPNSSKQDVDSAEVDLARVFTISSNLQDEYESKWREGSNFPPYEELLAVIERNKLV